jgi:DNA (cytosine-5)-methyltransferase 1
MIEQLDMFEVMYKKLMTKRKVKLGTFFSGIGAPEMAFTELSKEFDFNYETMFYSEIDKYAIKAYCAIHNQKEDDCLGSITDIKGSDLPYCDIWVGGFPCQDISLAGNGKGFSLESESRSSLGWEMIRLIREVKEKPMYILFENVAAIFNNTHRPILNIFKQDLEELGYTLYNDLLNAKDYGIPQNRNRYFLIAILGKYNYKFPKPIKLELRLKDMLEDEVDEKYYLSDKLINFFKENSDKQKESGNGFRFSPQDGEKIAKSITTLSGNRMDDNFIEIPEATKQGYAIAKDGDGVDVSYLDSETRRGRVQENMSGTIQCNDSLGVVVNPLKGKSDYGWHFEQNVYDENGITRALKSSEGSGNKPKVIENGLRIRKLTPKECYRLMGFSDEDYERAAKVVSNTQLYKTAGNSIVVNVLEAIFTNLFRIERKLIE